MTMGRRLMVLSIVMCVLLVTAAAFRWERQATFALEARRVQHDKDRWTGQEWETTYRSGAQTMVRPIVDAIPNSTTYDRVSLALQAETKRTLYTEVWVGAMLGSILMLLLAMRMKLS